MKKLLIANRGEIAVRVIRAARELGIGTVAVYSPADAGSLHVRLADQAVALGASGAKESYLNIPKLLNAARETGADAVHPGYGFLAENAGFARAVLDDGLIFVGPRPEAIALMGAKDQARARVKEWNVPIVPGIEPGASLDDLQSFAQSVGYPVLLKAAFGGSGRGMRVVRSPDEMEARLSEAQREAAAAFSDGTVFLEKYIERPRHIEVQIFGDHTGQIVHFGERECSLQRRHQKLVEEAPAPNLHPKLRERVWQAAVSAAQSVEYIGAGTVEFIVQGGAGADDKFYFLEMNTRIQVEHPVTEEITGVDLVKLQLQVAAGKPLPFTQEDISFRGHSLEFRIYAEKPAEDFRPTTGTIRYLSRPFGPGIREDGWVEAGTAIPPYYDSLLAKFIVRGATRPEALARAQAALDEYLVEGVDTTLPFHRWVVRQSDFQRGAVDTGWIERSYGGQAPVGDMVGPLLLPQARSDQADHLHK